MKWLRSRTSARFLCCCQSHQHRSVSISSLHLYWLRPSHEAEISPLHFNNRHSLTLFPELGTAPLAHSPSSPSRDTRHPGTAACFDSAACHVLSCYPGDLLLKKTLNPRGKASRSTVPGCNPQRSHLSLAQALRIPVSCPPIRSHHAHACRCPGRFQHPMKPCKPQHLGSIPTPHAAGAPFTATLLRSSNRNPPGMAEDQLMHQWV